MAKLIQLEGDGAQVDVLLVDRGEDISPVGVRDVVRETVRVAAGEVFASVTGLARQFLAALASEPVEQAELEVNLQFSSRGNLYVVSGEAQAAVKAKVIIRPRPAEVPT